MSHPSDEETAMGTDDRTPEDSATESEAVLSLQETATADDIEAHGLVQSVFCSPETMTITVA
ncbi:hypothetical protein ACFYST_13255 [Kitasatospora sp. NPDC004614]|uniref:hypothetical protein n=1 Tax=Kitasatospora sp. NPDC004614 TaxID=3364016 RepID=UPI003679AFB0